MARKDDLINWLFEALVALGGRGKIVDACKHVWDKHENELRNSGDLFYTWQYDIRWAAHQLRQERRMKADALSQKGLWELK